MDFGKIITTISFILLLAKMKFRIEKLFGDCFAGKFFVFSGDSINEKQENLILKRTVLSLSTDKICSENAVKH